MHQILFKYFFWYYLKKSTLYFIINNLQESVVKTEVLERFPSDHSPMAINTCLSKKLRRGSGLWKVSESLLQDENFLKELKNYIKEFKTQFTENALDEQIKWDFLKHEIRKFCVVFSKPFQ